MLIILESKDKIDYKASRMKSGIQCIEPTKDGRSKLHTKRFGRVLIYRIAYGGIYPIRGQPKSLSSAIYNLNVASLSHCNTCSIPPILTRPLLIYLFVRNFFCSHDVFILLSITTSTSHTHSCLRNKPPTQPCVSKSTSDFCPARTLPRTSSGPAAIIQTVDASQLAISTLLSFARPA